MKSVLISIRPQWCELIAAGKKTVEVRKTKPKLETPFKVYIYCTKGFEPNVKYGFKTWAGRGKVIGEFVCDKVVEFPNEPYDPEFDETANLACIDEMHLYEYLGSKRTGYGWHILDMVIYDNPKELGDFGTKHKCNLSKKCTEQGFLCAGYCKLTRPPQNWCYVEAI